MNAAVVGAVFAALFAGHHVGDHIAQTDAWSTAKARTAGWAAGMAWHLTTYHACLIATLGLLALVGVPLSLTHVAVALLWSVVTHGLLDRRWPVRWLLRNTGSAEFADRTTPVCGMYLADQSLHIAVLFVAAVIVGAGA